MPAFVCEYGSSKASVPGREMMFHFSRSLPAPMGAHKMKLVALPALCE